MTALPRFPKKREPNYEEKRREYYRIYAEIDRRSKGVPAQNRTGGCPEEIRRRDRLRNKSPQRKEQDRLRQKSPKRKTWEKEYESTPARRKSRNEQMFLRKHGITREAADEIADAQGGLCAICGLPPSGRGHHSRLHLDHDHQTGDLRAMLCGLCNTALGLMKDEPARMRAAAEYLEKYT